MNLWIEFPTTLNGVKIKFMVKNLNVMFKIQYKQVRAVQKAFIGAVGDAGLVISFYLLHTKSIPDAFG